MSDRVVKALLSVVMILADSGAEGLSSYMVVNALESIGAELDEMTADERREFRCVLERIALEQPEQGDWIRAVPECFGVAVVEA